MKILLTGLILMASAPMAMAASTQLYPDVFCVSRVELFTSVSNVETDTHIAAGPNLEFYKGEASSEIAKHSELDYAVNPTGLPADMTNGKMSYNFQVSYDVGNYVVSSGGSVANQGVIFTERDNTKFYGFPATVFNKAGVCKEGAQYIYCAATQQLAQAAADQYFQVDMSSIPSTCSAN